jgi:hypothetical protein
MNENLTGIITDINRKNSVYHLTAELGDILDNRKFFGRFRHNRIRLRYQSDELVISVVALTVKSFTKELTHSHNIFFTRQLH